MSRSTAGGFFLGDVAFLSDPKFRRLLRRLPDPDTFNSAVGAYFIALAASRREGSPLVDARAETESSHIEDLQAVGLLTADGFPVTSWDDWAPKRPAEWSRAGGKARAEQAVRGPAGTFLPTTSVTSAVQRTLDPGNNGDPHGNGDQRGPARPAHAGDAGTSATSAVQRVQPSRVERSREESLRGTPKATSTLARERSPSSSEPRLTKAQLDAWATFSAPEWRPFREAWLGRGFLHPPAGTNGDDDTSQRGLLWQVLDDQPTNTVRWVREAPGKTVREVVAYILGKYHELREDVGPDDDEDPRATVQSDRAALLRVGDLLHQGGAA